MLLLSVDSSLIGSGICANSCCGSPAQATKLNIDSDATAAIRMRIIFRLKPFPTFVRNFSIIFFTFDLRSASLRASRPSAVSPLSSGCSGAYSSPRISYFSLSSLSSANISANVTLSLLSSFSAPLLSSASPLRYALYSAILGSSGDILSS